MDNLRSSQSKSTWFVGSELWENQMIGDEHRKPTTEYRKPITENRKPITEYRKPNTK